MFSTYARAALSAVAAVAAVSAPEESQEIRAPGTATGPCENASEEVFEQAIIGSEIEHIEKCLIVIDLRRAQPWPTSGTRTRGRGHEHSSDL